MSTLQKLRNIGWSILFLLFALGGCSTPVKYKTDSSIDFNLQQKPEEDMVVIHHHPHFHSPVSELRIVLINENQPHIIRIKDPVTGKSITGRYPKWSPDGKTVGFTYATRGRAVDKCQIAIVRYDGTGFTVSPTEYLWPSCTGRMLRWSSDGSKLLACFPTSYSGSNAFGTIKPCNFEFDVYDFDNNAFTIKRLNKSIPIKEHAIKFEFLPKASLSGTRLAYVDQDDRLYLFETKTQKEIDLTSQIRNLTANESKTFCINDLDWINDEHLLVAVGNMLLSFNCKSLTGKMLFSSSSEIVRVKYLKNQEKLLVGYAWEKGTDISHVVRTQLITGGAAYALSAGTQQALSASTNIFAGAITLITLPWAIKEAKFTDTTFALVELDGTLSRSFCAFRNYLVKQPAFIGNISSKGRYVTIDVYEPDHFVHILDLETGEVFRAVGY